MKTPTLLKKLVAKGSRKRTSAVALFFVLILGASISYLLFSPPKNFPTSTITEIEEGSTGEQVAEELAEQSLIRSPFVFQMLTTLLGKTGVLYGQYYFEKPESVFSVARRLANGEFGLDAKRVTIPEGATIQDIGKKLAKSLPSLSKERFLELAKGQEGFLFPDTYLFLPNATSEHIIEEMRKNFDRKVGGLDEKLTATDRSWEEVVIMASILEKEALTVKDKRIIAGILWKRMEIGMPLQVYAPFIYAIGKNTFELTTEDLRADNPYNTYTRKGLPPTPIANPGIESIRAALNPKESPYLFYLSDMQGNMHYAINFEGHKRNKRIHLN